MTKKKILVEMHKLLTLRITPFPAKAGLGPGDCLGRLKGTWWPRFSHGLERPRVGMTGHARNHRGPEESGSPFAIINFDHHYNRAYL